MGCIFDFLKGRDWMAGLGMGDEGGRRRTGVARRTKNWVEECRRIKRPNLAYKYLEEKKQASDNPQKAQPGDDCTQDPK